jgi:hypothetical protein
LPGVRHRQCLGAALSLVVTGARTDGVDVPPILLLLGVLGGIAVDLGGGGDHHPGPHLAREVEQIQGSLDSGPDGPHRIALVMDGGRRAGQVIHLVHLQGDRLGDVVPDQLEPMIVQEVLDVGAAAGEEVVQAHHLVTLRDQALA